MDKKDIVKEFKEKYSTLDYALNSKEFAKLSPEDMTKVYFSYSEKRDDLEYKMEPLNFRNNQKASDLLNESNFFNNDNIFEDSEMDLEGLGRSGFSIDVCLKDSQPTGVIVYQNIGGEVIIPAVVVDPDYRKNGVMSFMFDSVRTGPLILKVEKTNYDAIEAFHRYGFEETGQQELLKTLSTLY